jgi:hypothetical protein
MPFFSFSVLFGSFFEPGEGKRAGVEVDDIPAI